MQNRTISVVIFVTLLGFATVAGARTKCDSAAARPLVEQAAIEYRLHNYEKARGLYRKAFKHCPKPGFILNFAQCYYEMGDWENALRDYELYLTDWKRYTTKKGKPDRPAPHLKEVQARIEECKRKLREKAETRTTAGDRDDGGAETRSPAVDGGGQSSQDTQPATGKIEVRGAPAGAQLLVDGAIWGRAPMETALKVAPGVHRVTMRVPEQGELTTSVIIEKGQTRRVHFPGSLERKRSTFWLATGIATAGLAVVSLGVGIGFNVKHKDAEDGSEEWADAGNTAVAMYGVAGGLAAASVVSWVLYGLSGKPVEEPRITAALAPLSGGGLAAAAIHF